MIVSAIHPDLTALPGPASPASPTAFGRITAAAMLLALIFAFVTETASAQSAAVQPGQPPASSGTTTAKAASPKATVSRPVWAQLTVQQQIALRPLSEVWDPVSEAQKRKWLELSKNYPSLAAEDQARMHSRMVEWVAMSPQQRAQARLNFAQTRELATNLSAEEKNAKWQSYQALTADEKQKLAEKALPKPTGAATAVTPVASQKLTVVSAPLSPRANRAETRVTPVQPVPAK